MFIGIYISTSPCIWFSGLLVIIHRSLIAPSSLLTVLSTYLLHILFLLLVYSFSFVFLAHLVTLLGLGLVASSPFGISTLDQKRTGG